MSDLVTPRTRVSARRRQPTGARGGIAVRRAVAGALTVVLVLLAVVTALAAISTRLSPANRPAVLGHPALAVLSGSMTPTIRTGDLAVDDAISDAEARALHAGQIISFHPTGDSARLFTHRIVAVRHGADGAVSYVTKGDANDAPDASPVPAAQVVGLFRFRVPYGGYALDALHRPAAVLLVIAALGLLLFGIALIRSGGTGPTGRRRDSRPVTPAAKHRRSEDRVSTVLRGASTRRGPRHARAKPRGRRPVVVGSVATLAASSVLVGATLALFSSTPGSASNGFTAGTVSLSGNSTGACNVSGLMPGDSPAACTFAATYSGSASAYLGLDVLIQTQAGTGGTKLYNPPASNNGVTVTVTDNQGTPVTYTVPTAATSCPGTAPVGSTCYELDNELVRTTPVSATTAVTFSTAVTLPLAAGNGYQGGAVQVILTAHAVQSKNQTLPGGCTAGAVCTATGSFAWS